MKDEVLTLLQSRRTIRRYTEDQLPRAMLDSILQAAQSAQSWNNSQCWECVVVTDPKVRKQLQQTVPTKNPAFLATVKSAALLAICAKTKTSGYFGEEPGSMLGDWFLHDIGIMTQNICLQAHGLGLGTVVIGWFDHQKAKEILMLPQGVELVSLIPIGYPEHDPTAPSRKSLEEFVHCNQYGSMYQVAHDMENCCAAALQMEGKQ
jgi:nitroreductase